MKLKVLKYEPDPLNYHLCESEQGGIHRVDFLCDGNFSEEINDLEWDELRAFREGFVGKTVEVERTIPFIEIAVGAKIINEVEGE